MRPRARERGLSGLLRRARTGARLTAPMSGAQMRLAFAKTQHSTTPSTSMRFGINSFLFTSPFTTESTKLFKKFKDWGFETVEIPIEDPSHIDPAKVKAAADKAGLAIGSVCACMGPGRDFRGSAEDQKAAMDYCMA